MPTGTNLSFSVDRSGVSFYLAIFVYFSIMALLLLFCSAAHAQAQSAEELKSEINRIEKESIELTDERRILRKAVQDLVESSRQVEDWFEKLNILNNKIKKLRQKVSDFSVQAWERMELQDLENQRKKMLNDRVNIAGESYESSKHLQSALSVKAKEIGQLNREIQNLDNRIQKLERLREKKAGVLEDIEMTDLPAKKRELAHYEDMRRECLEILNDPNMFCFPSAAADKNRGLKTPLYVPRIYMISLLTEQYMEEILSSPGMKYDAEVLAERVKKIKNRSNELKQTLADRTLPDLDRRIRALRNEIRRLDNRGVDISGCWVLLLGSSYPRVHIAEKEQGTYEAIITEKGDLIRFFKKNHRLFVVERIGPIRFIGTEYSYDAQGNRDSTPIKLFTDKAGSSMVYRSKDQHLGFKRCK